MTIKIEYLDHYNDEIRCVIDNLLTMRDKYDVVVDEDRATEFISSMKELINILETTQLA